MNHLKFIILIAFIQIGFVTNSQRLALGLYSGINFSDINNSSTSGKWHSMPGSTTGISFDYSLSKIVSLKAELNYLNLYYQYKTYYYPVFFPYDSYYSPLQNTMISYNNPQQDWSFSYLRLPLSISFRTPTKLSFYLTAGFYYSLLVKDNTSWFTSEIPNMDYGAIFSNGLSYTFPNRLKLNLELRYSNGKEEVITQDQGYNGALELSFGMGYVFSSKKNKHFEMVEFTDSLRPSWLIKYSAGTIYSNLKDNDGNHYKPGFGFSSGFSLIYQTKAVVSFQADVIYQRKSYSMSDSSSLNFCYLPTTDNAYVDSKTDIDFVNIPVVINFSFGKKIPVYAGIGLYGAIRMNARVVGQEYKNSRSEGYFSTEHFKLYDNIEGKIKTSDSGFLLNAGFQIPVYKKYLVDLNLRYHSSFQDLYKVDNKFNLRYKSLSVSAGLIIPII